LDKVKLYLDENVDPALAVVLRSRGYDVISAHEVEMRGKTDEEQLDYAIFEKRALVTFNAKHFALLAKKYFESNREHFGIIVSKAKGLSDMIKLTLNLLNRESAEDLKNIYMWLENYE